MTDKNKLPSTTSSHAEVAEFIRQLKMVPARNRGSRGRLLFALDATASREPTWDQASQIQAEMFAETETLGGLSIQLCWFRGFGEFSATPWVYRSSNLINYMNKVTCRGGKTQIGKVFDHALQETHQAKTNALVYVGDCLEEPIDPLCAKAGELALLGVPMFIFHEGYEPTAAQGFQHIARLTKGAYCRFDSTSPQQLRDLLKAVAVYAAGGQQALAQFTKNRPSLADLTRQIR